MKTIQEQNEAGIIIAWCIGICCLIILFAVILKKELMILNYKIDEVVCEALDIEETYSMGRNK